MSETGLVLKEKELRDKSLTLLEQAKAFEIVDQGTYDEAGRVRREVIKPWRKNIVEYHKPLKEIAKAAHQRIVDAEAGLLRPLDEGDDILERKRLTYSSAQERKRLEEQARLAAESQKQEDERRLAEAEAAKAAGADPQDVDAILETPSIAPPPVAQPTVVKTQGISTRSTWKAELMPPADRNLIQVVKYIAKNPHLVGLIQWNQSGANALARAQKSLLKVPGVRVYEDKSEAVR